MSLSNDIRPCDLDSVVGQHHLLGEGKFIRNLYNSRSLMNLIFYGPPGTGKTTISKILINNSNLNCLSVNGINFKTAEIKKEIDNLSNNKLVLFIDEIQYLNKKQQQSLLEYIELGKIILVATTTENPKFYIYNALLSRCINCEFKPIDIDDIIVALQRVVDIISNSQNLTWKPINIDKYLKMIAVDSGGDIRQAINYIEVLTIGKSNEVIKINDDIMKDILSTNFSVDEDLKYDLMSALQKSIRGSDADAAIFYLSKLLLLGDIITPSRRLMVIATEDIGLAYPNAISIVKACVDSARELGLPEARLPLAQATILLAMLPKSNSSYVAINKAMEDASKNKGNKIPRHLKNNHFDGISELQHNKYLYPHDYPNHYIKQQYLPDDLLDAQYYSFGDNKQEQTMKLYWEKLKDK